MLAATQEAIAVKNNLTVRPVTMADVEAAVDLFNSCSRSQLGVDELELNEVKIEWQTPDFSLNNSTRAVFSAEGKLVGYVEVWDLKQPPVHPWVWGRVHPEFEGQGIGTLLMTWAEARARQAVGRAPQGVRVSMRSATPHTHQPGHRLLQDLGMERIRHFWDMKIEMAAPPPEPRWPDGITLRPFNYPQDLRPVYLAFDDAFKDHWGHVDQPVEKRLKEWRHWLDNDEEFDPALWFVVVEGDEIAGMSLCRPKTAEDPGMAWVDILGVRRPWRKRGLGLALLHHTFGEFYRRGTRKVGLGVDAGSLTGATRLYERAGMRPMRQFDLYDKELRPGHELGTQSAD